MSIEDAESLRLLAPGKRREDVPDILKLAESFRRPRVAQVLGETRKIHSTIGVAERVNKNLDLFAVPTESSTLSGLAGRRRLE